MSKKATSPLVSSRIEKKAQTRQHIIDATLYIIATQGLAQTTITSVCNKAHISRGLIDLHFNSKQQLLLAVLQYLVDHYITPWRDIHHSTPVSAADRLRSIIDFELSQDTVDPIMEKAWLAYRGVATYHDEYLVICEKLNNDRVALLTELCADIIADGMYQLDVHIVSQTINTLIDGLWLDYIYHTNSFDHSAAQKILLNYLSGIFAKHFNQA